MSIQSLLVPDLPETTPDSSNTSFDESRAAEAPEIPQPNPTTSPVTESAPAIIQAEVTAADARLFLERPQTHAIDDYETITATVEDGSLKAALINSAPAAGQSKGKGKDPELYDAQLAEDGSIEDRHSDHFTVDNAADSPIQLRSVEDGLFSAASILMDLSTNAYESSVYTSGDSRFDAESEDEGPFPSAARKIAFSTSCHGNHLQYSALEGNAVFDLLNQRFSSRHHTLGLHNGETKKCHCEVVQESVHARYVEGYTKLGYGRFERDDTVPLDDDAADDPQHGKHVRFEREDTIPLDDDAVDSSQHGGHGTAEYDSERSRTGSLPRPPKLSQKTIARLMMEKSQWKDRLMATSLVDDTSVSFNDTREPTRLPLYAEQSYARGSANTTAVTSAEAAAELNASTSPPSSGRRPSYADREPGEAPLPADYINLTKTISSPAPSTLKARQKKPLTSSPLKRVHTALEPDSTSTLPEQPDQPAGKGGPALPPRPVTQPTPAPRSRYSNGSSVKRFLYRDELANERVRMGAQEPCSPKKGTGKAPAAEAEAEAGPSTPKKGRTNAPPSPPRTTGRKRKAITQAAEAEGQSPSQRKKKKAKTAVLPRDRSLWYVDGEGNWLRSEKEDQARRRWRRCRDAPNLNHGVMLNPPK